MLKVCLFMSPVYVYVSVCRVCQLLAQVGVYSRSCFYCLWVCVCVCEGRQDVRCLSAHSSRWKDSEGVEEDEWQVTGCLLINPSRKNFRLSADPPESTRRKRHSALRRFRTTTQHLREKNLSLQWAPVQSRCKLSKPQSAAIIAQRFRRLCWCFPFLVRATCY